MEWKRGEYLLLERNEHYWGPKPAVRQIRLRTILDANARVSSLLAKEVDAIAELGALLPAQAQQLKGQPGITVGADPITITQYIAFNCSKPPFDDVRLRRAVARRSTARGSSRTWSWATPRRASRCSRPSARSGSRPRGRRSTTWPRRSAGPRGAGRRSGCRRPSCSPPAPGRRGRTSRSAELLQQVLRPLGIDVQLPGLEGAAADRHDQPGRLGHGFDQLGWANGDPDFIFGRFMKSGREPHRDRQAGYTSAEADQLVSAGKMERDEKKRFAIYERLQELAVQDMPVTGALPRAGAVRPPGHHQRPEAAGQLPADPGHDQAGEVGPIRRERRGCRRGPGWG